ncbi:hypothetical protein NE237_029608 [Protea cynaroides]|uniref:Uncharacterized protein n=1 Tax=Protea cynaroides TaxID=273540 RepID=A0A9Q0GRH1_9MAGN|nr:hypothetical protein NE237_029608 [Protea cynaroides]
MGRIPRPKKSFLYVNSIHKSIQTDDLEKSANTVGAEMLANDHSKMMADLLAEIDALRSQLVEYKEESSLPKGVKSLRSRLTKVEKEKKSPQEALRKLPAETKSSTKESEPITDLLFEIEALHTQLIETNKEKKTISSSWKRKSSAIDSSASASELTTDINNLKIKLAELTTKRNSYFEAMFYMEKHQDWEVCKLRKSAKAFKEDRNLYYSHFVKAGNVAKSHMKCIKEVEEFNRNERSVHLSVEYYIDLYLNKLKVCEKALNKA